MADDTTKYGYDAMNRLTSADTTSSSGSSVSSYGYGYDGVGNLTSATVNGTTTNYTYNGASELTSQGASYDGAGDFTGGAGFSALAYNAGGQTTSVTPSGGAAASLSYLDNNQNQLVQAGDTTLDENALGIARSTAAGATTDYVYDPSGRLVAEHTGGATYYYLLGNLGSVLGLTDSSGKLVNSYTYTPYGQQTAQSSSAPNLFGFDGGLEVPGSGLIHFGARYYDPKRGQWTQPDPTGQDPAYVYTQDDPANYTDLSGQSLLELLFDAQDILNEFKADSLEEQLRVLAGAAAGAVFGLACSSAVAAAEIPTAGLSTLGEGGCVLGSAEVDKLVSGS
jgi:RHS repeat-associated protein